MIDIDRAFRDAEQMPVADLWPDIVTRTPGTLPFRSSGPRTTAILVAVVVAVLGIGFFLRAFSEGPTQPATRITNTPGLSSPTPAVFHSVYEYQGYSAKLSPDGTTVAFLRDPHDPHAKTGDYPFVLQVWLVNVDGSGLRKLQWHAGCCTVVASHLHWSQDGSSIVVIFGGQKRTIDVATGESQ